MVYGIISPAMEALLLMDGLQVIAVNGIMPIRQEHWQHGRYIHYGVLYHFDEKGILKTGVVEASEGYDVYNTDGTFLGSIKMKGWNLVNGSFII